MFHTVAGGLFEPESESQIRAFELAVDNINGMVHWLPYTLLVPDVEQVPKDSFETSKRGDSYSLCNFGEIAIFI